MVRFLDQLLWGLGALILLMLISGGARLEMSWAKIEFAALDPWVGAWALLAALRFALKGKPTPSWNWLTELRPNLWVVTLWITGLALASHTAKHWSMGTHAYDLTFLHQSLFYAFDEIPLRCDICLNGSFFGEHISPSLLLVAPFTQWVRVDEWVFFLQVLIVIVPILILLKHGPTSGTQALGILLLIVFCSRSLRSTLVWDFREDHLAFGSILLAWVALYRQRYLWFLGLNLVALGCKENVFVVVLASVAPLLYARELLVPTPVRRQLAGVLTLMGLAWGGLTFAHFIPSWSVGVEEQNNIVLRLSHFGSTPGEILITLLTSPSAWWSLLTTKVLTAPGLKYLVLLIGPYFLFMLKAPGLRWWWVPILPGLAMNLLSGAGTQIMLQFHYDLVFLPFLILALVFGAAQTKRVGTVALLVALALSGRWLGYDLWRNLANLKQDQVSFLRSIPAEGLPLATPLSQMAWLSHVRDLRDLRTPPAGKGMLNKKELWELTNGEDRTALKGRGALSAGRVLLNLKDPWQAWARQNIYGSWVERSQHGDWVYLTP